MVRNIPVRQLDAWLDQGFEGRIIDLRPAGCFRCSHLEGAENYPMERLMENPDLLTGDQPILFYCERGNESLRACLFYDRRGWRTWNLAGGFRFYDGRKRTLTGGTR